MPGDSYDKSIVLSKQPSTTKDRAVLYQNNPVQHFTQNAIESSVSREVAKSRDTLDTSVEHSSDTKVTLDTSTEHSTTPSETLSVPLMSLTAK